MAFAPKACSLFLVVLLGLCIQLNRAQYVPGARCKCPETIMHTQEAIVDFEIIEKTHYCDTTEIIVTLEKDKARKCLNPVGKKAMFFVNCWNKINKDNEQKRRCLKRKAE